MAKIETTMMELQELEGTEEWRVRFTWKGHDMDISIRSDQDHDDEGYIRYYSEISEQLTAQTSDDWDGNNDYAPTPGEALNRAIAAIILTDWPDETDRPDESDDDNDDDAQA